MPFAAPDFVKDPTVDALTDNPPRKDDWTYIAKHFGVGLKSGMSKHEIKVNVINDLVLKELLPEEALTLCDSEVVKRLSAQFKSIETASKSLTHLDDEAEKERIFQLQKIQLETKKLEIEERKIEKELELARIRNQNMTPPSDPSALPVVVGPFDVAKVSRLVPCFDETDPEVFFRQFEKIASTLSWPRDHWTILIQTVLKGKGALVYANLSVEESKDYELVKNTVLAAYELTVEGYRQKFRNTMKSFDKTYVEFANEKHRLFRKWLVACSVDNFDSLCNLVVMEEFKRCIPLDVKLYLEDREITLLKKAAVTADSYSLLHKQSRPEGGNNNVKSGSVNSPETQGVPICGTPSDFPHHNTKKSISCSYCKKDGHDISGCWSKNCKQSKHYKPSLLKEGASQGQPTLNFKMKSSTLCSGIMWVMTRLERWRMMTLLKDLNFLVRFP